jgi:hypothetical protein
MKVANIAAVVCLLFWGCKSHTNQVKTATTPAARDSTFTVRLPGQFTGRGYEGEYAVYSDSLEKHNGHNVSTIRSLKPVRFATIFTSFNPQNCIGKRIKYTAWVRAKDVKGWAGLWMRIDPADMADSSDLGFDNMERRPIKGTNAAVYEVVLDVPEGADEIYYGVLLEGEGQIWVDSMDIKIVDKNTPRTDQKGLKLPKVL